MNWFVSAWKYKAAIKKQNELAKRNERLNVDRDWYRDVCKILEDEWYRVNDSRKKAKADIAELTRRISDLEKQLAESTQRRIELARMYDELMAKYKAAVEGGEKE